MKTLENLPPDLVKDVEACRDYLTWKAYRAGYTYEDAEDLVSDAILRFYLTSNLQDPKSSLLTKLIHSLTHRICRNKENKRVFLDIDDMAEELFYHPEFDPKIDVRMALEKLDRKLADKLIQHIVVGRSLSELAKEYGITPQGIHLQIQAGLKQLQGLITKQ